MSSFLHPSNSGSAVHSKGRATSRLWWFWSVSFFQFIEPSSLNSSSFCLYAGPASAWLQCQSTLFLLSFLWSHRLSGFNLFLLACVHCSLSLSSLPVPKRLLCFTYCTVKVLSSRALKSMSRSFCCVLLFPVGGIVHLVFLFLKCF